MRPMFDVIRVAVIGGAAVGSLVLLGDTPIWAVAAGVGGGGTLGWIQGRNVAVRTAGKRAYEKRNVLAIIAFGVGLVLSQGAGLLNRTGVIGIGVGITFLSAATLAGLIAGRRKPLGLVRSTSMVWIGAVGVVALALFSTWAGATAQEPTPEEKRKAAAIAQLTDAVPWDSIEITGGLFTNAGKPFATIVVPSGLNAPPDPLTRTVEWTRTFSGGGEAMYRLTETFTFALNADGVCCTVSYDGEGSDTFRGETTVTRASGVLGDYVGVGARRDTAFGTTFDDKWGLPFQETQMLQPGTDEPFCRRPVAQPPGFSSNGAWEVYETDGVGVDGGEPLFGMYTQCDIDGFDAATAQSLLPPVPAATAPEREVRDYGATTGGCPVYQEAFNALHVPSAGSAPTEYLQRLIMRPNSAACSAWVFVGEEGRGGVRSQMQYDLATENEQREATRLYDAVEDLYTSLPAHEIPEDETCDIGGDGITRAPLNEDKPCRLRTFHKFGEGEITIWTDYDTSDGPNVIVRGAFPWGHCFYTCHHCDPSSPEVPRIIAAMHRFGTTGIGNFGPNAQVIGSVGAPEGRVGKTRDVFDVDPDLVDLFADDPNDPIERAAIAAALGLIASGAMVGLGLAENRLDRKEGSPEAEDDTTDALGEGDDKTVRVVDHENGTTIWMTRTEADEWYAERKREEFEASIAKHDTFAELLERSRKEALDWLAEKRAKEEGHDEASILLQDSDDIRDRAAEGGYDDILDFLERSPLLTPEQVQELYDALNRRAGDEAVLEKMGEVNVFWETVTGSQKDIAKALEATGQPILAWAVRNPGLVLRVGAAVATGGWSEVVAVPLDIVTQLRAAQEKSLEENGRLMTSEELFGELGWAVGVEVIYEVGGRAVAAGLGKAAQVWRGLDEATEAVVRQADELAESGLRQADELLPVPPKGNEALKRLPPGTRVSDDLLAQTGFTQKHLDDLAAYAKENKLEVGTRAANPYSAKHLADGSAIRKPLDIKAKTVGDVDVMLGADPAHRGTVGLFNPKYPSYEELQKMSPDLRQAVESRYQSRLKEFAETRATYEAMDGVRISNGQIQKLGADGKWRNYAGDMDLVYLRDAAGNPLPPGEYDRVVAEMRSKGLIEHGGEVRVMEDVMREAGKKFEPGSAEWTAELRKAIRLREALEAAHADEIVVAMMPNGKLVRGEAVEELLSGRVVTDDF